MSFHQNKTAKFMIILMSVLGILYLCLLAVAFASIANNSRTFTAVEFICGISPFILAFDFFFRFMVQEIPSQLVKPYILLPISKYSCVDNFIGTSLLSPFNFTWFSLFIPFILMAVVFNFGIGVSLGILLFYWLAILINTQWYHITRTLINDTMLWWLLPLSVYALIAMPWFIGQDTGISQFFKFYAHIGTAIADGSLFPYIGLLVFLTMTVAINRRIQYAHIATELARVERTRLRTISSFNFFNRFGAIGNYLQLEIKLTLRNKNPRKSFISSTALVLFFSLLLSFTDIYDSTYMTSFLGCYNFVIFGAMFITRIMCSEGNYIDCLMTHQENILSLLRAKYIFYSAVLLLPFLLMLPTVFTGKWSILMLFAYVIFTAGFQYFVLFQMAVYNKQTVPLNTKFISKGGMENNYMQIIANIVCLFMPSFVINILRTFLNENSIFLTMIVIGAIFIITSNWWLRNIYNRMMRRRYTLLEGFQSSR